jgi:hypothetical protein
VPLVVDEAQGDAVFTLRHADAAVIQQHSFRPYPLNNRAKQHHVQLAAMDAVFWERIARRYSSRFAINVLAKTIVERAGHILDAEV